MLSGGERNRYALARILVSPSNFLLLDEPTNHLDMRAKDVLLEALAAFSGTVVFVSHDRYFIDRLATRVLEVENGTVTAYEGNYEDYLAQRRSSWPLAAAATPEVAGEAASRREGCACRSAARRSSSKAAPMSSRAGASVSGKRQRTRRLNPIKQKQMEDRCAFLEEEIPRIEAAIAHTEQQLGVYVSAAETQRLTDLAAELRAQLAALTAEWEELMMQLGGAGRALLRRPQKPIVHNQKTMALLWNPESWSQRLAELEAQSGDLKEAPLRRDVRSLGTLLGEVLREQAGEDLFAHVEALRQGTIRRRDAEARGKDEEAARHAAKALELVHSLPVERAILLTRAFAFYFELINLAETNHRKRRRIALQLSGEAGRQRGSLAGTLVRDAPRGHQRRGGLDWLRRVLIVPVFTAHPTEVARRSVMFKRRRIGEFLAALDRIPVPEQDLARLEELVLRRDHQPVADRRGALAPAHRLRRNQDGPRLLRCLHLCDAARASIAKSPRRCAPPTGSRSNRMQLPLVLHFGSWIGGDRDGNPFVTPEVTRDAIQLARGHLLLYYQRQLDRHHRPAHHQRAAEPGQRCAARAPEGLRGAGAHARGAGLRRAIRVRVLSPFRHLPQGAHSAHAGTGKRATFGRPVAGDAFHAFAGAGEAGAGAARLLLR